MSKTRIFLVVIVISLFFQGFEAQAQEARARSELLDQIRSEKFDIILPKAMRDNKIDMWITMVKFGRPDPLSEDLGGGGPNDWYSKGRFLGYYIFTDRGGDRIERAVLGVRPRDRGVYDIFALADDLKKFVAKRDPKRIGINKSVYVGAADGISHTCYLDLVKTLGKKYAGRLVSAEKLVCDFRSQRVATELALYAKAGDLSRKLMERSLSNEVITPGVTTLEDVGWWIADQLLVMGYPARPGFPGVRYPKRSRSRDYVIQRGELLSMDWGMNMMGFFCDIKRHAYVLREGETDLPPSIKKAFQQGLEVRKIIRKNIKPGGKAIDMLELLYRKVEAAGYQRCEIENQVSDSKNTEVNIGMHSVGNWAHGVGPAIWNDKPFRNQHELKPTHLMAFEFFMYVPLPEWGGKKLSFGIEDDVVITENGFEWLYPEIKRINLIR